jgi:vancomycin resistance protein VanJ
VASRVKRFVLWAVRFTALAYPLALLLIVIGFRLVGERWWGTTVALYLPRLGFALPLPFIVLALLLSRSFWWLGTQLVAVLILLFPLMGLHLSFGTVTANATAAATGGHALRVLTLNANEGRFGVDHLIQQVREAGADLILVQEAGRVSEASMSAGLAGYHVSKDDQFVIASRFPIKDTYVPPHIVSGDPSRTSRFIRYQLETPGGLIHVYNMHPASPRDGLEELRGDGWRNELTSGRFLNPASGRVGPNTALRLAQVQAVAEDAAASKYPVLIAGDTNLPEQSWALRQWLGAYRDAFAERGSGFGYTFPAPKRPWMRIDRILVGPGFRVLNCQVLTERVSDHLGVVADLQLPVAP